MKKTFILVVVLCASASLARAQSFTVISCEYMGNSTQQEFQEIFNDMEILKKAALAGSPEGWVIETFARITDEDWEDKDVVNYLARNRLPAAPASGDVYLAVVQRQFNRTSVFDGWLAGFRHNGANWNYYLIYYHMRKR